MKVAIISPWYSEKMGYAENFLPKAIAKLGHEVHLVTSNAQIYYNSSNYKEIYEPFIGPNIVDTGRKELDGYDLHRLPYYEYRKGLGIKNLQDYLIEMKPDVIQTFNIYEMPTYDAAIVAKRHGVRLFTESHLHASVFSKNYVKNNIKKFLYKNSNFLRTINEATVRCYPISTDAAEIAISFYRVPESKIKIQSLGVDTDLFQPCASEGMEKERSDLRRRLGFSDTDIVCIYTGRFTKDKNPHCLAKAINLLRNEGLPFKGIFVGKGAPDDIHFIQSQDGCYVHPFVSVSELPAFYRASDIGVWPAEESTSQLDAMACGLPLVLSNRIKVLERIEGNGFLYEDDDSTDLAKKLRELKSDKMRKKMADHGVEKIMKKYSWDFIAEERLEDYRKSLGVADQK